MSASLAITVPFAVPRRDQKGADGGGRVVQMEMDVTPDGGVQYHLAVGSTRPRRARRSRRPGAPLAVTIDPTNPAMVAIDWGAS